MEKTNDHLWHSPGKTEIKNGWEFELNIKLNFFIISTPMETVYAVRLADGLFTDSLITLSESEFSTNFPRIERNSIRLVPGKTHVVEIKIK